MRTTTTVLALLSIFGLSMAAPTPIKLAPRSCTTLPPFLLQQLTESSPYTSNPNTASTTNAFHVEQTVLNGQVTNRVYQIAAFTGIPSNAYGCQLNVAFPSIPNILTTTGNPQLNVTTLYKDSPSLITYPNNWDWNTFFPPTSPPSGQGLFGTITFAPGQSATINSELCGQNLAFLFEIASWVSQSASVDFAEYYNKIIAAPITGVYLTHSC